MVEGLGALYAAERARIAGLGVNGALDRPVFGEGPPGARLMLIGEAPGAEEAASGHPFVGKAGRTLSALLAEAGLVRAEVFVTNAVKYRPISNKPGSAANRTPARHELADGLPLLAQELALVQPAVIATLGNAPLWSLCRLAGLAPVQVGAVHGKALPAQLGAQRCLLFPLYHPASIIYNRALAPLLHQDIAGLGALLQGDAAEKRITTHTTEEITHA